MAPLSPSPVWGPSTRSQARWAAWITWSLLALVVTFSLVQTSGKTETYQDADFGAYYRAGLAVAKGESPYTIDQHGPTAAFVYAPAYACFFSPLSCLDYLWANRLWMLLNWASCVACVALALALVVGQGWGRVWLATMPLAGYFWANVRAGQAGALVGVWCLGWALCQRRGLPFVGGLLLALAVALKVAPVVLLPALLVRRDWRGLAGAIVGGLTLFVLPILWVGWEGCVRLHLEWPRLCQATQILETCTAQNQSLLAILARLPPVSDGNTIYSDQNLRSLVGAYPLVVLAVAGVIYAWIVWGRWRSWSRLTQEQAELRDNRQLALVFIFMAVVSPRAWPCNFVVLIVASLLLADTVWRRGPGWLVALGALGLLVVVSATPRSHDPVGSWSWLRWWYQGKDFWALVVVAIACALCHGSPTNAVSRARVSGGVGARSGRG